MGNFITPQYSCVKQKKKPQPKPKLFMKISGNKLSSQSLNCKKIPGVKRYCCSKFPTTVSTSKTLSMQVWQFFEDNDTSLSPDHFPSMEAVTSAIAALREAVLLQSTRGWKGGGESHLLWERYKQSKIAGYKGNSTLPVVTSRFLFQIYLAFD